MIKNIPIDHPEIYSICKHSLDCGKVVIYPTDTLYGFGVDATNDKAIDKLNSLKNRKQVYSILLNSVDMIEEYAQIDHEMKSKILERDSE